MSSSSLAIIAELGDLTGIDVLNPLSSHWSIVDASSGSTIINPDTVPKFEYRGDRHVSDYPVEQGAFASYNKVVEPFAIRMVMVCSGLNYAQSIASTIKASVGLDIGKDYMSREDFLDTLDYMLDTTDLFTIVTPDAVYKNANLEHYDYRRETRNGATMLIVEAWFREVRVSASATYTNSHSPSAADAVSAGGVKTSSLGANQSDQWMAGPLQYGIL